jgi:hypothetical protein
LAASLDLLCFTGRTQQQIPFLLHIQKNMSIRCNDLARRLNGKFGFVNCWASEEIRYLSLKTDADYALQDTIAGYLYPRNSRFARFLTAIRLSKGKR